MRQIERWLHQHIFKVGWLLSHNYETTTILYYTVFLPGVILHEVVYWLMAGVMNVRADRSIQWPEKQEIGQLKLNFVKLSPKANPIKRALIAASPLIVGLLAIWIIGINIFQLESVVAVASSGNLSSITEALQLLTSTPDFWLWFYISFTIANTMFPTLPKDMQGWWQIGGIIAVILIAVLVLGIGQTFLGELTLTLSQLLNSLALVLLLTIGINITMVIILGAIESAIERITGHSATFQKGKMITMTREEALKLKQETQEKRLATRSPSRRRSTARDLVSVYALEFPIPGPPGQEPITKGVAAILDMDAGGELPDSVEDDEIVETTATDSTRQRMLRLFPETADKTNESEKDGPKSIAESTPALPDAVSLSPKSQKIDDVEDVEEKGKQAFDIRPVDLSQEDEDDEQRIRPVSSTKPPLLSQTSLIDDEEAEIPDEENEEKFTKPASTKRSPILSPTPSVDNKNDESTDEQEKPDVQSPVKSPLRSKINRPSTPQTVDEDDSEDEQLTSPVSKSHRPILSPTPKLDDKEESDTKEKSTSPKFDKPSKRGTINLSPTPPSITDDEDEDEEQLITRKPRSSSIFDDLMKPSSEETDEPEDDVLFGKRSVASSASPFDRPFVKRDEPDFDDDEDEDETIEPTSQFSRPFMNREITDTSDIRTKSPTSWRDQLSSTPASNEDKDEDDEQLSTRLPRRASNIFDSIDKPTPKPDKKPTLSSSWRDQLTNIPPSNDEEDEETSNSRLAYHEAPTCLIHSINLQQNPLKTNHLHGAVNLPPCLKPTMI